MSCTGVDLLNERFETFSDWTPVGVVNLATSGRPGPSLAMSTSDLVSGKAEQLLRRGLDTSGYQAICVELDVNLATEPTSIKDEGYVAVVSIASGTFSLYVEARAPGMSLTAVTGAQGVSHGVLGSFHFGEWQHLKLMASQGEVSLTDGVSIAKLFTAVGGGAVSNVELKVGLSVQGPVGTASVLIDNLHITGTP